MKKPEAQKIPTTPGVYLYSDERGVVIYVGKAKNLRNRVLSYFRKDDTITAKTRAMLAHAHDLRTVITETEKEALLLEASLIKKHRPRYNILLRDDKDYVLFRINMENAYPRLEVVRRLRPGKARSGHLLFGPYSSAGAARETWRAIHRVFPLRRCTDKAFCNRSRPCLYYHMHQCLGPCVMDVDKKDYAHMVKQVVLLLRGKSDELTGLLKTEMEQASENLDFEHAAVMRDRIAAVKKTVEHQSVVLASKQDMDVLGIASVEEGLALGILFIRGGVLLDTRSYFWPALALDDAPDLLESFLVQFYQTGLPVPPRIVAPWIATSDLMEPDTQAEVTEPARPEIQALAEALAEIRGGPVLLSNARSAAEDALVSLATANAREVRLKHEAPIATALAAAFGSEKPVERIEAVDVSHTGGSNTRVGMVVFQHEQPMKNDYRTYAVDAGGDDFAALYQWAVRRATAGAPWPDLMLIDGGRGQIAAVDRAFTEAGVAGNFILAGIAKARTEEGRADRRAGNDADRIFLPQRSNPLPFAPGSRELFFLQHVRDTVHDFAIGRHRKARAKQAIAGELLRIPGVGPKTARALWDRFGSLAAMTEADEAALASVPGIGPKQAAALFAHLRKLTRP